MKGILFLSLIRTAWHPQLLLAVAGWLQLSGFSIFAGKDILSPEYRGQNYKFVVGLHKETLPEAVCQLRAISQLLQGHFIPLDFVSLVSLLCSQPSFPNLVFPYF